MLSALSGELVRPATAADTKKAKKHAFQGFWPRGALRGSPAWVLVMPFLELCFSF